MAASARTFLAFDLGAESGRAVLGALARGRLRLREVRRFPNEMVSLGEGLHWDAARLFGECKQALRQCAAQAGSLASVAVDTWGVDFGLLDEEGRLIEPPRAYRDRRTAGAREEFFARLPRERVYGLTGIQFLPFNSLFQLQAMVRDGASVLPRARDLLFMPDLISYFLSGEKRTEFTFATTSQLYNPVKREWEEELFSALGLSRDLMQEIVAPGTVLGALRPEVCRETGLAAVPVVATASHDTASAVAAAPGEGRDWAYISSGTWSLMGVESERPILTGRARELNLTNEGGVGGTFRVLKNIMGLWLLQQCRKAWATARVYSYEELVQMAAAAPAFGPLVDPDREEFLNPPDMPEAIRQRCRETGERPPESEAEFVRCVLESLALKYRLVLDQLREVHSQAINRIHIIGGGTRNEMLCQLTADATGLPVSAGPAEATAAGNVLIQALGLGYLDSVAQVREVVRRSFPLKRYLPRSGDRWEAAYERFRGLCLGGSE